MPRRCRWTWARTRGWTSRCTTPSHGRDGRSGRSASRTRSHGCRSTGIRSCSQPGCAAGSAPATSRSTSTAPWAMPRRTGVTAFPGAGGGVTPRRSATTTSRSRSRAAGSRSPARTSRRRRWSSGWAAGSSRWRRPLDTTRVTLAPGSWLLRTRGRGYDVEIAGDADGGRSARAARPRRRRAARRAAVAPASGGQPLAAGATRRAPALRRPLAARGARARPSAQRLSARRAASLSGSAPTSGSKRPITVHSALSRTDA